MGCQLHENLEMGCQLHENLEIGCQNVADFLGSLDYLAIYSRVAGLLEIIYFIPAHQKSFILTSPLQGGGLSEIIYTLKLMGVYVQN